MSDEASHEPAAPADNELFSVTEVEQFSADDVKAGGDIGKMLSALFLYTILAMGIASWWSWSSIVSRSDTNRPFDQGAEAAAEHADGEH
ncbi:MAG: hypothetical protein ACPGXX_00865 [Planctomycetaceae bacterium]